jgi:predicted metal-dependent hydrolase
MDRGERKMFYSDLGDVTFRKSHKAKRLTIRVKSEGRVIVTIPYLISLKRAMSFIESKKDWILRVKQKIELKRKKRLVFDDQTVFFTAEHKVVICKYPGFKMRKILQNKELTIMVPETYEIKSWDVQDRIRSIIIEIWRREAKEILVKRTIELSRKYHFEFSGIRIKEMKTRWGSCSGRNSINLNLHLVRLPQHLQDYVILHELVHTIEKNHGNEFRKALNRITGEDRKLSKELKNVDIGF